jgi:hypothetical protein
MVSNMIAETIAVGVISAGAAIASQFVGAWSKSQSDRYIKKIEYLQNAQEELGKFLEKHIVTIPSFDANEIIASCNKNYLENSSMNYSDNFQLFNKEYRKILFIFFKHRNLVDKGIRSKCDSYYIEIQNIILDTPETLKKVACDDSCDSAINLSDELQRKLVANIYILASLTFLGIIKVLEQISDQVTK